MTEILEHVTIYDDHAREFEWTSICGSQEWILYIDASEYQIPHMIQHCDDGLLLPLNWEVVVMVNA